MKPKSSLPEILRAHQASLASDWVRRQQETLGGRIGDEGQSRDTAERVLKSLSEAAQTGDLANLAQPAWAPLRDLLGEITRSRALEGYSPSETATFVFSLKQPLFDRLRQELGRDAERLAEEIWGATLLLDKLGLYTIEVYQKTREEVIPRQQQELLELSTPVVRLWDGSPGPALIGTLDSARTQVVMESLLQRDRRDRSRPSPSSTSPACRPWTPWWPSTS